MAGRHLSVFNVARYSAAVSSAMSAEQHDGGQLRVDHGVVRAGERATVGVGELVARAPSSRRPSARPGPRAARRGAPSWRGAPSARGGATHRCHPTARGWRARGGDEADGDEQPVEHERDERQLEHVEADVVAELRVGDAERLAVAEHQPVLPAADRRARRRASANTPATPKRSRRRRWPKNSWKRSTTGWVLAENGCRREPVGDDEVEHRERRRT